MLKSVAFLFNNLQNLLFSKIFISCELPQPTLKLLIHKLLIKPVSTEQLQINCQLVLLLSFNPQRNVWDPNTKIMAFH